MQGLRSAAEPVFVNVRRKTEMGSVFSRLFRRASVGDDDPYKQYVISVVTAVEEGEIDRLREIQDSPGLRKFGGIENISTVPSLIQRAAAKECNQIVRFLIELGVNVDQSDSCEMTALHEACKRKSFQCVSDLVSRSKNMDKRDIWGRTPLLKALVYKNEKAAQLLLEKGANPNAIDIYGITPLSTAVNYNMLDMLRLLVNHGADINMVTIHQMRCSGPPLYQAVINQNVDIVDKLLHLGVVTQPRPQDYCDAYGEAGAKLRGGHQVSLAHSNVVMLAMSEMVKRNSLDASSPSMEILMTLIAAHGYSLGSSPEVMTRVLINSRPEDFSLLLYKLQICSSSSEEELLSSPGNRDTVQRLAARSQHLHQLDHHLRSSNSGRMPGNQVRSLQNQARRVARQAMMCSGHNVVWAAHRLQCPPALKSLLLLKDIDRAFSPHPLLIKSSPNTSH